MLLLLFCKIVSDCIGLKPKSEKLLGKMLNFLLKDFVSSGKRCNFALAFGNDGA